MNRERLQDVVKPNLQRGCSTQVKRFGTILEAEIVSPRRMNWEPQQTLVHRTADSAGYVHEVVKKASFIVELEIPSCNPTTIVQVRVHYLLPHMLVLCVCQRPSHHLVSLRQHHGRRAIWRHGRWHLANLEGLRLLQARQVYRVAGKRNTLRIRDRRHQRPEAPARNHRLLGPPYRRQHLPKPSNVTGARGPHPSTPFRSPSSFSMSRRTTSRGAWIE